MYFLISSTVYDEKKKLITGDIQANKYPSKMIIHCKDLRVFQFCLTYTKEEDAKRVIRSSHSNKVLTWIQTNQCFLLFFLLLLFFVLDLSGYCSPLPGAKVSEMCLCFFLCSCNKFKCEISSYRYFQFM